MIRQEILIYANSVRNHITKTEATRRYHADKWIRRLKPFAPQGLNNETGDWAKVILTFTNSVRNFVIRYIKFK